MVAAMLKFVCIETGEKQNPETEHVFLRFTPSCLGDPARSLPSHGGSVFLSEKWGQ